MAIIYTTKEQNVQLKINSCFDIPNQQIDEDSVSTISINLNDYINDPIKSDSNFVIRIKNQSNASLINCNLAGSVITCANPAANQSGFSDINISATVVGYTNYDIFRLNVNPVNDPVKIIRSIPNVIFDEGTSNSSIDLDDYALDIDNTNDQLIWTASGNTNVKIDIASNHIVTFSTYNNDWFGKENITFTVSDGKTTDSTKMIVTVVQLMDDMPTISDYSPKGNVLIGTNRELA